MNKNENLLEILDIPIKMDNGEGLTNAVIHLKRYLLNNKVEDDDITVIWKDGVEEVEHCYYEDLNNSQKHIVDMAIFEYDRREVQKNLL